MSEFKYPTEVIELPSKGLVYPETSLLSSGTIELKYMSAHEEDILTNPNYLEKGIVIDKLLQSLIVSKIDYNELITGDKNAILVAARILGYGAKYDVEVTDKYGKRIATTVDLSSLENKQIDETKFQPGNNNFEITLPQSNVKVRFKLLNQYDENKIEQELKGLKKIYPEESFDITVRLKHTITAVNGDSNDEKIRMFVDSMRSLDVRALRKYINEITPDLDMSFSYVDSKGDVVEGASIPMTMSFFWPDVIL